MGFWGDVFVARGGTLALDTPVRAFARSGKGFSIETASGGFSSERLVLNLTHWDALRLASDALKPTFEATVRRHPDAWATFTLYLGVSDGFGAQLAPYQQVMCERPLAVSGARSLFVTLGRADDRSMAPEGFRSVTVSCHTEARAWEGLSDDAHAAKKAAVTEEVLTALDAPMKEWMKHWHYALPIDVATFLADVEKMNPATQAKTTLRAAIAQYVRR